MTRRTDWVAAGPPRTQKRPHSRGRFWWLEHVLSYEVWIGPRWRRLGSARWRVGDQERIRASSVPDLWLSVPRRPGEAGSRPLAYEQYKVRDQLRRQRVD